MLGNLEAGGKRVWLCISIAKCCKRYAVVKVAIGGIVSETEKVVAILIGGE